jgi:hypothetical protein
MILIKEIFFIDPRSGKESAAAYTVAVLHGAAVTRGAWSGFTNRAFLLTVVVARFAPAERAVFFRHTYSSFLGRPRLPRPAVARQLQHSVVA